MTQLYVEIGALMRSYRRKLAKTQAEIAELAGIDSSFYGQIERGANVPSLKTFIAIARALSVAPAKLLPGASRATSLRGDGHRNGDGDGAGRLADLLAVMRGLPARERDIIIQTVSEMAQRLRRSRPAKKR